MWKLQVSSYGTKSFVNYKVRNNIFKWAHFKGNNCLKEVINRRNESGNKAPNMTNLSSEIQKFGCDIYTLKKYHVSWWNLWTYMIKENICERRVYV
jgi:hypothetical protein